VAEVQDCNAHLPVRRRTSQHWRVRQRPLRRSYSNMSAPAPSSWLVPWPGRPTDSPVQAAAPPFMAPTRHRWPASRGWSQFG